jgi:hypothetical protein
LALIALGRAAGFSLDEIALMFAPDGRTPHRPKSARGQGGGAEQDYPSTNQHARQPAARRRLPCAEPYGMSNLPPNPAGRRVGSTWTTKEKESYGIERFCLTCLISGSSDS